MNVGSALCGAGPDGCPNDDGARGVTVGVGALYDGAGGGRDVGIDERPDDDPPNEGELRASTSVVIHVAVKAIAVKTAARREWYFISDFLSKEN